jgi:predicted nuclease of predicted toxin-antitoxin system
VTIRWLVNENFLAPSTAALRNAGFDVLAIAESHPGVDDTAVLSLAREEGRWLVTFDRDYGELLFLRGYPAPPAVILLRVSSYRPEEPANWLARLHENSEGLAGKFTVFTGNALRSRPLLNPNP